MERTNIVRIFHDYTDLPIPEKKLLNVAKKIIDGEQVSETRCIDIVFCSDYKIKKLNAEYLSKSRVTDVIAFPFEDEDLLGEIYISLQRAAAQAKKYDKKYDDEVVLLFVHGMLHLLGYDDTSEAKKKVMVAREELYGSYRDR
jgi:probable rRNA maturation factor